VNQGASTGSQRLNRLRWQCRRGMKELDIILERFLEREKSGLEDGKWPEFERFLRAEDDQLWDWFQQKVIPEDPAFQELARVLRG
jgi:antitoxin CptB